jgi:hypothetical protein
MRTFLGFCLLSLVWSAPVLGREIFVDNNAGDDRFSGQQPRSTTDLSGPVRTIANALRLAGAGDVIVLAKTAAPYRESISLVGSRHSGTVKEPFVIRGNGAVLDGTAPVPARAWEPYKAAVFRFRPVQAGYQRLFLDGRPAVQVAVTSADRARSAPPELKPRQWCSLGGYLYFCVERSKLPADYQLTYARQQTGITLYHVDYATVADLTVQGFQVDGISLANSARHVSLMRVSCRDNGRSGVTVGGASLAAIEGSRLGGNGQAQLLTLAYSETHLHDTKLLSDTAPGWVDQGGRVYRDAELIKGGLDEFHPQVKPESKP